MLWRSSGIKPQRHILHKWFSIIHQGEHITDQRHSQGEEPGIDEKVVASDFDDVKEQWGHRQQDTLGHYKLLYSVLEEEPQRLRGREDIKINKDNSGWKGFVRMWMHLLETSGSLGLNIAIVNALLYKSLHSGKCYCCCPSVYYASYTVFVFVAKVCLNILYQLQIWSQ